MTRKDDPTISCSHFSKKINLKGGGGNHPLRWMRVNTFGFGAKTNIFCRQVQTPQPSLDSLPYYPFHKVNGWKKCFSEQEKKKQPLWERILYFIIITLFHWRHIHMNNYNSLENECLYPGNQNYRVKFVTARKPHLQIAYNRYIHDIRNAVYTADLRELDFSSIF